MQLTHLFNARHPKNDQRRALAAHIISPRASRQGISRDVRFVMQQSFSSARAWSARAIGRGVELLFLKALPRGARPRRPRNCCRARRTSSFFARARELLFFRAIHLFVRNFSFVDVSSPWWGQWLMCLPAAGATVDFHSRAACSRGGRGDFEVRLSWRKLQLDWCYVSACA